MTTTPLERRLRFWLWWMDRFERWGWVDGEIYYWLCRRAAGCNSWRKT
ncbi:MAG: hypothetical protein RL685_5168 [Pseudomonadota bacterium]|jgi:hypothetical protein